MEKLDLHIVQSLQQRDKKAIALLYDQYAATLYGVVLKIVRSEVIAQDVLQEAFVKIWKNGPQYDPQKGTIFTWMLNIARNLAIDKTRSASFRHSGKIQTVDHFVSNNNQFSDQPNVDQIGLDGMVNDLDDKYRQVIDLVYFQGYTHKEVMEELNLPLGTVKSRIRLGLQKLRKVFGEFKVAITIACWFMGHFLGPY